MIPNHRITSTSRQHLIQISLARDDILPGLFRYNCHAITLTSQWGHETSIERGSSFAQGHTAGSAESGWQLRSPSKVGFLTFLIQP